MKKNLSAVFAIGMLVFGNGCISKYSHAVSASNGTQGQPIEAEASGTGILMLSAPDLNAGDALKAKCPSGKISNVETQSKVRNLLLVQLYAVEARGVCTP